MSLEMRGRLPEKATGQPPLLFVHGAWLSAWCWDEYFLPFFAEQGYAAHAVSLRGHGGSPGSLFPAGLSDYVSDLAEAVARLPAPPVLIGHSMGGGVVQKYLETHETPAAILLGSMPPHGMASAFMDAWRRHPLRLFQANLSMNSRSLFGTPAICREFFFSPATSDAEIARLMSRADNESPRALFEMSLPNLLTPGRVRTPMFVVGGQKDIVIPPDEALATARNYRAPVKIVPGAPHAMMLDALWRDAAEAVLDFLRQGTGAGRGAALS